MRMPHRLYRSRTERWIAGVCGGLSTYLDVDVSVLRLAFALLTFWHGFGLLLYLLIVVIVPEEPLREATSAPGLPVPEPPDEEHHRRRPDARDDLGVRGRVPSPQTSACV
jgi:phage shock protein PspC (stress-responsive transcriptional regulator)